MAAGKVREKIGKLPGIAQLQGYRPARQLPRDLAAGVAVGAMLVPQGLAFAELAGMRAVTGLWAGMLSLLAYALLGGSRQLIVGPEAGTAILTFAVLAPMGLQGAEYEAAAGALALLVAGLLLIGGLVRAGAVADFLSRPVLVGYLNGVAWVLIASQLAVLLGLEGEANGFIPQVIEAVEGWDDIHSPTLWHSVVTIAVLVVLQRFVPRVPGTVVVLIGTVALSAWLGFEEAGIDVVGEIEQGLPTPALPIVGFDTWIALLPGALSVALLAYASNVLTGRSFGDKRGYRTSANQEFFGLAAANVLAGFFRAFPVAASESRTAVNDAAGGRTQIVSIVAAVVVLAVLLFLTSIFALLPSATLGAVVVVAGFSLIDFEGIARLWRARSREGALALLTMIAVLVFGILQGILIAVVLSLGVLIHRATRPHDAVLGKVRGKPGYHDVAKAAGSAILPGLIIYRVDAPLFFANARHVKDQVRELIETADEEVRLVVLDAGGINDLDMTAAEMLGKLHGELREKGVTLAIAEPHAPLREMLHRSGLLRRIGEDCVFPTVGAAIRAYVATSEGDGLALQWKELDQPNDRG